jgi:hypothetical protein
VNKYKKGSEMLLDFLSPNAIDAVGIFSDHWKLEQERDEFFSSIKQHMQRHKAICSRKHLEIADSSFMDYGILWKRIQRHGKQKTVKIYPQTLRQKVITDTHGDIIIGHESTNKTKEKIISSYWWPGMDTEIDIHIKSCEKCQRTRKDKRGSTTLASPLPQCSEPNQRIHMDLLGLFKKIPSGKKFIFCITD